jgi:hypothetical protein
LPIFSEHSKQVAKVILFFQNTSIYKKYMVISKKVFIFAVNKKSKVMKTCMSVNKAGGWFTSRIF